MRATILFLLFTVAATLSLAAVGDNKLPEEVAKALRSPEKVILYSLEPVEQPSAKDETFHRFKVLGQVELDREQAAVAGGEFQRAVDAWDQVLAACFEPRQGLRITAGGRTYDLLLCYSCHQLYVYEGDNLLAGIGATGSPDILNALLTAAKIKLSTNK